MYPRRPDINRGRTKIGERGEAVIGISGCNRDDVGLGIGGGIVRGDVVIFRAPDGRPEDFIKRIIAIPGDMVEVKNRAVFINGVELDETYIQSPPNYTVSKLEVPKKNYFVLGDNRNYSNDSHHGWFLPRENIIGKAWLSTWPPDDWGVVPNYPLEEQLVDAGA